MADWAPLSVPYATRNFTPTLSFTQDWFRYDDFSELDFDAQTLVMDFKYDLNRDDTWYVDGSYALARLSSPDTGEFYRYGFLNGSITHLIQLQTAPVSLWLTGGAYWRHGDPSPSDRISGCVSFSPFARTFAWGPGVSLRPARMAALHA